jgi:ribonuclease HI
VGAKRTAWHFYFCILLRRYAPRIFERAQRIGSTSARATRGLCGPSKGAIEGPVGRIVAYTDGGCRGNPGGIGAWAFVLVDEASRRALERADAVDDTTNNRMEMAAAIEALAALRRMGSEVVVCTDSRYLVDCCTKWMRGWKARGWARREEKEGPLKNVDLLRELDRLMGLHAVTWRWVQGHAGHRGNERVDQMANEAMDRLARGEAGRYERRTRWKGKLTIDVP